MKKLIFLATLLTVCLSVFSLNAVQGPFSRFYSRIAQLSLPAVLVAGGYGYNQNQELKTNVEDLKQQNLRVLDIASETIKYSEDVRAEARRVYDEMKKVKVLAERVNNEILMNGDHHVMVRLLIDHGNHLTEQSIIPIKEALEKQEQQDWQKLTDVFQKMQVTVGLKNLISLRKDNESCSDIGAAAYYNHGKNEVVVHYDKLKGATCAQQIKILWHELRHHMQYLQKDPAFKLLDDASAKGLGYGQYPEALEAKRRIESDADKFAAEQMKCHYCLREIQAMRNGCPADNASNGTGHFSAEDFQPYVDAAAIEPRQLCKAHAKSPVLQEMKMPKSNDEKLKDLVQSAVQAYRSENRSNIEDYLPPSL